MQPGSSSSATTSVSKDGHAVASPSAAPAPEDAGTCHTPCVCTPVRMATVAAGNGRSPDGLPKQEDGHSNIKSQLAWMQAAEDEDRRPSEPKPFVFRRPKPATYSFPAIPIHESARDGLTAMATPPDATCYERGRDRVLRFMSLRCHIYVAVCLASLPCQRARCVYLCRIC
jgi:hypothetical protein